MRNGSIAAIGTNPHHESGARGVPRRYRDALAHMGWRTIAYGPVEITV